MLINCISTNLFLRHRAKKHVKQEANYLYLLTRSENSTEIEKIFIFWLQTLSFNWELLFDGFFPSKMKFLSDDELDVWCFCVRKWKYGISFVLWGFCEKFLEFLASSPHLTKLNVPLTEQVCLKVDILSKLNHLMTEI